MPLQLNMTSTTLCHNLKSQVLWKTKPKILEVDCIFKLPVKIDLPKGTLELQLTHNI